MSAAPVIEVCGLSKSYRLGATHQHYRRLSETLQDAALRPFRRSRAAQHHPGSIWALDDVSLSIDEGEVVGIIGRNGSGKSTLLKILSRVTHPTAGEARLRGRVGALLEVGTGFHAELSGRENIFLNGAMLGMSKRDIRARFDEIVAFAEVERFLDTPVKRYSSGMYVRLAFAVAAHLEPDILLVDEVLAVGDVAFQRKCLGKMEQVAGDGRTVLFVSHNMTTIQSLCQRAYLLDSGHAVAEGDVRAVVDTYLRSMPQAAARKLADRTDRQGDGSARLVAMDVDSAFGPATVRVGEPLRIRVEYESPVPLRNARLMLCILDTNRTGIYVLDSHVNGGLPADLPPCGTLVCETGPALITPGPCYVNAWLLRGGILTDFVINASMFDVVENDPFQLGRLPDRSWAVGVVDQRWQAPDRADAVWDGTLERDGAIGGDAAFQAPEQ
jgi:lipopolysaccharide transport system ATP-binding protein